MWKGNLSVTYVSMWTTYITGHRVDQYITAPVGLLRFSLDSVTYKVIHKYKKFPGIMETYKPNCPVAHLMPN